MANMLAMGLDPVQDAIRQKLAGGQLPAEPVVPQQPQAAAAPMASPQFASAAAPMPAQAAAPMDVTSAIRTKIAPQPGQTRTFPNGRVGRWDGTGWEHIG